MAVVDSADREVVPELGVPLNHRHTVPKVSQPVPSQIETRRGWRAYGPISDGVTGSEGGGGRLISVGVVIVASRSMCQFQSDRDGQG